MKNLSVDNLGFVEIGGIGEMVYTSVHFRGYTFNSDDNGEYLTPVFLPISDVYNPQYGTDYGLTGQELLVSLCNLYRELNDPSCETSIDDGIYKWCRNNVHPYDMDTLAKSLEDLYSGDIREMGMYEIIQKNARVYIDSFQKDLCDLGTVFEYYYALKEVKAGNADAGRQLYYEGRMRDSLPFLEKYRRYSDDDEYIAKVTEDYDDLIGQVIDMIPDFRMRLKQNKKRNIIEFGADTNSVFDICWYTFARMVADVAPPLDEDLDYLQSTGSILTCMACGQYFVRHSSRQLYCTNPDCQAERNKRKSKRYYDRKKAEEHDI